MGDEVLRIVAQIIREKCRPYDCIGRWTGDEFVIALPGVIGSGRGKDRGTNHQNHRRGRHHVQERRGQSRRERGDCLGVARQRFGGG